jgi:hypothetical protein
VNLSVEIDGKPVPLDECNWVMWGPCGCPWGVTMCGVHRSYRVITEDDAWKQFYDRKKERDIARRCGTRMELMTFERWKAEVCERMKTVCHHDDPAEAAT